MKKLRLSPIVVLAVITWLGWTLLTPSTSAQSGCCNPPISLSLPRWAHYAQVTVTIDTEFTQVERDKIVEAFQEWNALGVIACTHVTFIGFTWSSTPPPIGSINVHWVNYQDRKNDWASAITTQADTGGITQVADTVVYKNFRANWSQNHLNFLRGIMRHEIGHCYSLDNHLTCPNPAGTVMYVAPVNIHL